MRKDRGGERKEERRKHLKKGTKEKWDGNE